MESDSTDTDEYVVIKNEDLDDYNPETKPQSPETISKIRTWLQPTDFHAESSEYKKHLHNHVNGTGLWMQATEAFQTWHGSPTQGSLWVKAIAGAGKIVFAATIAYHLTRDGDVLVLPFFFRQIVATNHHPQALARDWLVMILDKSPFLQGELKEYLDDRRALGSVTTDELWQHFVRAVVEFPKVYLVVDALDEMDIDQEEFLAKLVDLGKRKPASVKLLTTSRPLPRIEAYMKDSSVIQTRLEQSKVDEDIMVYVSHRLQQNHVGLNLQTTIKQAMGAKAQGSFLYARLMMDELLELLEQMEPNITAISRSLSWLPGSLEDMYNGMLVDHSLRSSIPQDLQFQILSWVTHSTRPLRLLELSTIVDAQSARSGQQNIRTDTKAVVRAACGPLLEILEDETISIIHHSFTEFLTDISRVDRSILRENPQFPVIVPAATHKMIAIACLSYLSTALQTWKLRSDKQHDRTQSRPSLQANLKMEKPFLDYAINNWYSHVRKCEGVDEELFSVLDGFMDMENHAFNAWIDMGWADNGVKTGLLPLHISAWAGFTGYTCHLLRRTTEFNPQDHRKRTPLSYAAASGHVDVVSFLLEHVDDPDVDCANGLKPIYYAAQKDHYKVVKLLLQAGVSPLSGKTKDPGRKCGNVPSSIGHTPLMYACRSGNAKSINEIIPYLKPEDITRALCWASESGKSEVVDLLLLSPEIPVDGAEDSTTALYLASSGLRLEVMRSLLKAGADAKRRSKPLNKSCRLFSAVVASPGEGLGPTPLHALCGESHSSGYNTVDFETLKKCVLLLLEHDCDINAIDHVGMAALSYVVSHYIRDGSIQVSLIALLLQNGANPTICDSAGNTPLHNHKLREGSGAVIKLFLDYGADLLARRQLDGRTPIHTMVDSSYRPNLKPLLPFVHNWDVQDDEENTPLHIIMFKNHNLDLAGLQDLFSAGAGSCLGIRNQKGEVPHLRARELKAGFLAEILPELTNAGADLEARDDEGKTLFLQCLTSTSGGAEKTLQDLLELGANLRAIDNEGNGCLHVVCKMGGRSPKVVKFLLDAGADPLATNHAGNNILHEALDNFSKAGYEPFESLLTTLLELEVPTSARNKQSRTPLHLVFGRLPAQHYPSYNHTKDPLDLILGSKIGENINDQDEDGIAPIHLAATLSEQMVGKLIQYGADPFAKTCEDKNVLHIAARTRGANVVGFFLEHLTTLSRSDMVNSADDTGRTPLHYACRSGRPETVALLLDYGADPKALDYNGYTPLHVCAEFEEENLLWTVDPPVRGAVLASGILDSDHTRPSRYDLNRQPTRRNVWDSISNDEHTARISEIVYMLLRHGAELCSPVNTRQSTYQSLLQYAIHLGCSEMVEALKHQIGSASEIDISVSALVVKDTDHAQAAQHPPSPYYIHPLSSINAGTIYASLFNSLLRQRQFSGFDKILDLELDLFILPDFHDLLRTLTRCGYAGLLTKLGDSIQQDWIYGFTAPRGQKVPPFLITACGSNLPNLEVMKVIVEHFGADVNHRSRVKISSQTDSSERVQIPGSSALHALARGVEWWKTKGIEYLLEQGADINIKDEHGCTPLVLAIQNTRSFHLYGRPHIAELLLKHGADPNILDNASISCLSKSMHDIKLVQLLLDHGADITLGERPVLLSAIVAQDIAAVSLLLDSGADCNQKRKTLRNHELLGSQRLPQNFKDYHYYPLHLAASAKFNTVQAKAKAVEIIKLLLANGANPYLQYDKESIITPGASILHEIFRSGGILQPFLELPNLDIECRDQNGNTLLLAAAFSTSSTNATTGWPMFATPDMYKKLANLRAQEAIGDPSPCYTLFKLGGNMRAINEEGNNVLHIMAGVNPLHKEEQHKAILEFINIAPELVDMPNKAGNTPLHLSLQNHRWELVQALLDAGADALQPDSEDNTALHHIAPYLLSLTDQAEHLAHFNNFLALGISINARNKAGETPLFHYFSTPSLYSLLHRQEPLTHRRQLRYFIEAGADIFARDDKGQTLLHVVVRQKRMEFPANTKEKSEKLLDCFRVLMEMGVDPMVEDGEERTSLDVAAACGKGEILKLFKIQSGGAAGVKMGTVPPIVVGSVNIEEGSNDDDDNDNDDW